VVRRSPWSLRSNRRHARGATSPLPPARSLLAFLCLALAPRAAAADDSSPPVIEHRPLERAAPGGGIEIRATIKDESGVAFPRIYYRGVGEAHYQETTMVARGAEHVAVIPALIVTAKGVEYYIEAFDSHGNGPAHHGTPEQPHRVAIAPRAPRPPASAAASAAAIKPQPRRAKPAASTPWYRRWWLWTAAGAVVAGTVTAVVVVATRDGAHTLTVSSPSPKPTAPGL
jgi:hypothetical protein